MGNSNEKPKNYDSKSQPGSSLKASPAQKQPSENEEIFSYFNKGKAQAVYGHPFDETSYRCLIKSSSDGKSVWAFNRAAFFSLLEGFILGLYGLYGLIVCQNNDNEKLAYLKRCLIKNKADKKFDESTNGQGAEKLNEDQRKLIQRASDFINKAFPRSEIEDLFIPGKSTLEVMIEGGIAGAGAGVGFAKLVGASLVAGGFIGAAIIGLLSLVAFEIFHITQIKKTKERNEIRESNLNTLFELLKNFFDYRNDPNSEEKKLEDLENHNLFVIKIALNERKGGVSFDMIKKDSISSFCDRLPGNTSQNDKPLREYYKDLLNLYKKFFKKYFNSNLIIGDDKNKFRYNNPSNFDKFQEGLLELMGNWKCYIQEKQWHRVQGYENVELI